MGIFHKHTNNGNKENLGISKDASDPSFTVSAINAKVRPGSAVALPCHLPVTDLQSFPL
jgi:hypothetical protein